MHVSPLRILTAALGLLCVAAPASGQSLLANRGLGLVVEPASARALALGGAALGLVGSPLSWTNPADNLGVPAPGLLVSYRFDEFEADLGDRTATGSTARFPLLLGAFPVGTRWAFSLGYGGLLDQNWAVEQADTLRIGGDTIAVRDRAASEGGVGRVRVGAAYRISDHWAVGAAVDLYTGSTSRSIGRLFPNQAQPQCCSAAWDYHGTGASLGVTYAASEALQAGAMVGVGGTLDASPDDEAAAAASYELPVTAAIGGSARLTTTLLAALSGSWTGWSELDERLASVGGAYDSWSVRGGVEWDAIRLRDRPIPLRLGGRYAQLPFGWDADSGALEERVFTAGTGLVLAGGAARTDVAWETGSRGDAAAGVEESFWRLTISLSALGR